MQTIVNDDFSIIYDNWSKEVIQEVDKALKKSIRTVTKELKEGHDDIYTTQILALAGAQELFEEIYVDNEIIWPNEKQHITNKELRPAHNLAKLVGCWYRYTKEGEPI